MIANHRKIRVFPIASFILLSLAGAVGMAQGGYELRCRGRGGAFSFDRIDANTISLRFAASSRGAGTDGSGLEPGTCAWIDRAVNSAEPLLIQFSADESRATSISQQLRDPDGYWSFFVNNTNKGYFQSTRDNAWSKGGSVNADVTSRTINADGTARRGATTNVDITSRRPGLNPSAGVAAPAIEKKPAFEGEDLRVPAITEVRAIPSGQNVTFTFATFPNSVPLVEIAPLPPVKGANKRWGFPTTRPASEIEQAFMRTGPTVPFASGVITRAAGGDKANGRYTADMNQELDPGITYYYIINVKNGDDPSGEIRQVTGKFRMPGSNAYEVRYRGFFSEETTTGPGSDEIYAIVSTSFVNPSGGPATSSGTHPGTIVTDVRSNQAHGDPGRSVYQGGPVDLLVTVTLMEHDSGDPNQYKTEVHKAVLLAVSNLLYNPTQPGGAINIVSNAVRGALGAGDDVIATSSRVVTAAEMKFMANNGAEKPNDRGMIHDFFTEHRGQGGVYRVYFDIITQ